MANQNRACIILTTVGCPLKLVTKNRTAKQNLSQTLMSHPDHFVKLVYPHILTFTSVTVFPAVWCLYIYIYTYTHTDKMLHITGKKKKSEVRRNPKSFQFELTCSKHISQKGNEVNFIPTQNPSHQLHWQTPHFHGLEKNRGGNHQYLPTQHSSHKFDLQLLCQNYFHFRLLFQLFLLRLSR